MAKGFKSGGRQKGTPNAVNKTVYEIAAKFDIDPFEILMHFCAGDWEALGYDSEVYVMETAQGATKIGYTISPDMRLQAAKEASKYLYSQKKAVELSGESKAIKIVIEDYKGKKDE